PVAAAPLGSETVRLSAVSLPLTPLSSSPETVPAPPPPAQEEWRGFELEPEPFAAPSALEIEEPFALEEPAAGWQGAAGAYLPDGEPLFELEETAAPPPAGDVFGFEPQPLAAPAPGSFEALTSVEDDLLDTERLGVPPA